MKTKASLITNSIIRSPLRQDLFLTVLVLACFALSPQARAVCQHGCLTNDNTVLGQDALVSLTTGSSNTAIGFNALFHLTTGGGNTAIGCDALKRNTTGVSNTATGGFALLDNTTGSSNTATGGGALFSNTTGSSNTATGHSALLSNTTGLFNTATGDGALQSNRGGRQNTATGSSALSGNKSGSSNTANGEFALIANTTGSSNTANGQGALVFNVSGNDNTATGVSALSFNTSGSNNIALGVSAGSSLTTGDNNIDIGNQGVAAESNTIRIGKVETHTATFIAGISGATVPTGVAVIVDSSGHLGTTTSSARFKDEIKPMDKASEAILALNPVTFYYKHELDPKGIPQFGLVTEDVEKVNPDLVARNADGKAYTVRYEAVNAMLLNEFLKEHRTVQGQQKEIDALKAELKEQKALIQKVSAEIELSKAALQTVGNNQ